MNSGQYSNFLEFPDEIILAIWESLDTKAINQTMPLVSKRGYGLFADDKFWETKLCKEFGYDKSTLHKIIEDNKKVLGFSSRGLYSQLMMIKSRWHHLPLHTKYFLCDINNLPMMIACLTRDVEYFKAHVDEKHFHIQLFTFALFAGASEIANYIFENNLSKAEKIFGSVSVRANSDGYDFYLDTAIRAGNMTAVNKVLSYHYVPQERHSFLALKCGFKEIYDVVNEVFIDEGSDDEDEFASLLQIQKRKIYNVVKSGSIHSLNDLLSPENLCSFDVKYLIAAAKSGSVDMFNNIINLWQLDESKINDVILMNAEGELLAYLLDEKNDYHFTLDVALLKQALKISAQVFFNYYNKISDTLTSEDIFALFVSALKENNQEVTDYFLKKDPTLFNQITITELNNFISLGNLRLVKLVLEKNPELCENLNSQSLKSALNSQSFALIEYLLNFNNQFNIEIENEHLLLARASDPLYANLFLLKATIECQSEEHPQNVERRLVVRNN